MPSTADDHPDHAHPRPIHRRDLLKSGALLGASAALLGLTPPPAARAQATAGAPAPGPARAAARNLIVMVSDGMSAGTLTLADLHRRRVDNRQSAWPALWSRPGVHRATMRTHSLNSPVTDSAAAATAWGSGRKVNSGAVNVLPDGSQLVPILLSAMQAGKRTGLVTTTRITHATPAGFIANVPARDMEDLIARQMLSRGVDVLMGGGSRHFPADLLAESPGVRVVRDASALAAAPRDGRLLGLFADAHVPYVPDRAPGVPGLPAMARAALDRLHDAPEGFVLQVEAGRVDHAAHANDARALLAEQLEFDAAVESVVAWLDDSGRAKDTLLIVTTDHGNANPGLTLYTDRGHKALERLAQPAPSFERIEQILDKAPTRDAGAALLPDAVRQTLGLDLTPEHAAMLSGAALGRHVMPFSAMNAWTSVLGLILADSLGVSFISRNHTADHVELTAIGPGSQAVAGLIDNTDMHALMMSALAIPEGRPLPDMLEPVRPRREPKGD
jgi:alkaline phosphatase